jgi:flagellar biosynthetic protein FlhB
VAEDMGEKTELPTDHRRSEARDKGQIARSTDLSSAVLMTAVVVLMILFAQPLIEGMAALMRHSLGAATLGAGITADRLRPDVTLTFWEATRLTAPIMALMVVVAVLAMLQQVGFKLSTKALEPKWDKLNFVKNLNRLVNKRSLVKAGLDLLKLAIIGAVVLMIVRADTDLLIGLANLSLVDGLIVGAALVRDLALWVLAVLIILGILDFTYQRWQHTQDLKMTKHEVKDERKSTEGDLETKARRLKMARQIAMQRLGIDVPKADVIVTNPTHYAVALKYDADSGMNAPRVIAKGADFLALRIRYIAAAHGVPIVERPPLARALYRDVKVGREISQEHYEAVAEVLAYVYRLDRKLAS